MAEIYRNRLKWESEDGNTYIFDKNIGASVVGQDVYSTDAVVIGEWIDGKPIYRKVIKTTLTNPSDIGIDINDTVDSFVSVRGNAYDSGNNYTIDWSLPFARHDSFAYQIGIQGNNDYSTASGSQRKNTVRLVFGSNLVNRTWKVEIIVEYTKTTDAPGSYKPTSTELTQEHLTGETFNGKPVYEKYIDTVVNLSTSVITIPFNISNIGVVIDYDLKALDTNKNWSNIGTFPTQYWNGNAVGISVACVGSRPNSRIIAFVKYTKTTD